MPRWGDGETLTAMSPVHAIAQSGLNAATRRLEASASNIANMRSFGSLSAHEQPAVYAPLEVQLAAQAGGGVSANIAPSARAALLAYDPSASFANAKGYVAAPDVDLTQEIIHLAVASYEMAANLAVIRTADNMTKAVLNARI
jgi:flagellar basal-body rod protein FlgC